MMSDLFKRQHGVTPRQYREQHPLELARPRRRRPIAGSRWRPTGCMRDSMSRNHATESPPADQPTADPGDQSARSSSAPAALRHTRMVVTVRELDDLLRADAPGTRTAAPRPAGVCHRYQRSLSAVGCSAPAGTIRRWPATPAGTTCSRFLAGWRRWAGR